MCTLADLAAGDLAPRDVLVQARLARKAKNLFTKDVLHDFAGAAFDAVGANAQERVASTAVGSVN